MNEVFRPDDVANFASWSDLDRCAHGRHMIDPCFGCPSGRSTGNLYLFDGRRIGTYLDGREIRVHRVAHEEPGLDIGITLSTDEDGTIRLILARDIPPDWRGDWDGRETGQVRIWPGTLAYTRFRDGESLEGWITQIQSWWAEEKRKRPWL